MAMVKISVSLPHGMDVPDLRIRIDYKQWYRTFDCFRCNWMEIQIMEIQIIEIQIMETQIMEIQIMEIQIM